VTPRPQFEPFGAVLAQPVRPYPASWPRQRMARSPLGRWRMASRISAGRRWRRFPATLCIFLPRWSR
jgi:hypothetical protein